MKIDEVELDEMINSELSKVIEIIGKRLPMRQRFSSGVELLSWNGKSYLHNYGWKEQIVIKEFGLVKSDTGGIHGLDTRDYELKSQKLKVLRGGYYNVTSRRAIGSLSRNDKKNVNEGQNYIFTLFNTLGEPLISFFVDWDEKLEKIYNELHNNKKKIMEEARENGNTSKRDDSQIRYEDLDNLTVSKIYIFDDPMNGEKYDVRDHRTNKQIEEL